MVAKPAIVTATMGSNLGTARPFLKWVGGKGRLLAQYQAYFPDPANYQTYFEPFFGGGAVFFALPHHPSHINDANHTLMAAYTNIQQDVEKVIAQLAKLEQEYKALTPEEQKGFFYGLRAEFNALKDDDFAKTPLLIFLNRTCFNGLYRENSKGEFNVPFGRYTNPTILDAENLRAVAAKLQDTAITALSYEQAIKTAGKGSFVYFDPPYHPLNETSSFTAYHEGDFTVDDHIRLRDTFVKLASKGALVMLSNSDTPFTRGLYKGYKIHKVQAGRAINSVATKRGKITELVITNY